METDNSSPGTHGSLCRLCNALVSTLYASSYEELAATPPVLVKDWLQLQQRENPEIVQDGEHQARPVELHAIEECYICGELRWKGKHGPTIIWESELHLNTTGCESFSSLHRICSFSLRFRDALTLDFHLDRASKRFKGANAYGLKEQTYQRVRQARLSSSTGSIESLELIAHWLRQCSMYHKQCNARSKSNWYPQYLLDVSGPKIKLIDTTEHELHEPYMTLSYCWGGEKFLILTKENMNHFYQGVDLQSFQPCFRDAITVARYLEFRYIWIDSYCIIQSSRFVTHMEQKMAQISQMKDIYAKSWINLGIGHARGPAMGCFVARNDRSDTVAPAGSGTNYGMEVHSTFHLYRSTDVERLRQELQEQKLLRRGWVLQERLLPTRMVIFAEKQLFWECSELECSEVLPFGEPRVEFSLKRIIHGPCLHDECLKQWFTIVTQYSATQLTYPLSDKLAAIGGIARYLVEKSEGVGYVAGFFHAVFRTDLIKQLCWSANASDGLGRATKWRAPSWSWASMNGKIEWPSIISDRRSSLLPLANIGEINVELKDPNNNYGALASGSIGMGGRLIQASWEQSRAALDRSGWCMTIDPAHRIIRTIEDDSRSLYAWAGGVAPNLAQWDGHLDRRMLHEASVKANVYFLPLCDLSDTECTPAESNKTSLGRPDLRKRCVVGLLVQKSPSAPFGLDSLSIKRRADISLDFVRAHLAGVAVDSVKVHQASNDRYLRQGLFTIQDEPRQDGLESLIDMIYSGWGRAEAEFTLI